MKIPDYLVEIVFAIFLNANANTAGSMIIGVEPVGIKKSPALWAGDSFY